MSQREEYDDPLNGSLKKYTIEQAFEKVGGFSKS